jgi:hypothetical protein
VVWDIGGRSKRPPWGDDVAPEVTGLAKYFVTGDGRDLSDVLPAAVDDAGATGQAAVVH